MVKISMKNVTNETFYNKNQIKKSNKIMQESEEKQLPMFLLPFHQIQLECDDV